MTTELKPLSVEFSQSAVMRKVKESTATAHSFFEENLEKLCSLAVVMATAFNQDRRLFVIGNGGSACDAEHVSVEFMHPIFEKRRALPCICLSSQPALLTAVANDIDFSAVYSVPLRQLAKPGDMVLAISTSGMSPNLVRALQEAKDNGLITIGFNGKDGGRLKSVTQWSFIVPSYSIHRIQETHVMLLHILWDLVHLNLGEEDIV